jgi:hypothetical protein
MRWQQFTGFAVVFLTGWASSIGAQEIAVALPAGVKAVWDIDEAERIATPTRERICLNGLWRWQPTPAAAEKPPAEHWGYFKVPGCWPGVSDYMQKDDQTVFAHPSWKDTNLAGVAAAWYEREFTIPDGWAGRRLTLQIDYLNSYAVAYVDGKNAGEVRFPGGEVDLTKALGPRPQGKHLLSLLVVPLPLKGVLVSYSDSATARTVKGTVPRRGLCGDVFLASEPAAERIGDVRIETSVRDWQIRLDAALDGLAPEKEYRLQARVVCGNTGFVKGSRGDRGIWTNFTGPAFKLADLKAGRISVSQSWKPDGLWDIHTPGNQCLLSLTLLDSDGKALDVAADQRFGFREFWIDGRDFYLNGSRIFLSAVPLDNAQIGAALAGYDAARESFKRLKTFGINFVYTHNYGCEPGSHLSFAEILRAADDVGMLVSFSQPHFSHYEWPAADADRDNGYARHAEFYVRAAQNHPAVVCYSMSHNATGYDEDMNPDLIDGLHDRRDNWAVNNSKLALRAEAIVRRLDPSRFVYHHASGNLGSIHNSNFYPNFAPIQELSDWFRHWATEGVKPVFLCEYGAPFTWDWAMYRGWHQGKREFGSANVPWEFCFAEWNSQFLGDRAFRISEMERANLRWEAPRMRDHQTWFRWDEPYQLGSRLFDDRNEVLGRYTADNWRAFRTWGVSGNSPWEYGEFWKLRDGVDKRRKELKVDWDKLQRPGFSADFIDQRFERMDLAYELNDWIPTAPGLALLRNNRPRLAYIAGKAEAFTSHDHNFHPGETVEKQLVVINNSRQPAKCETAWTLHLPQPVEGQKQIEIPTGGQERVALKFELPQTLTPGSYKLTAQVKFDSRETQEDAFSIRVLPRPAAPQAAAKIALFDPLGETASLLKSLGYDYQMVDATADLSSFDILVVGKSALSLASAAPNIARLDDGLKVLVFEQSAEALEKRLGFRVVEYGLRQAFPRVPDHPALAGIGSDQLADWRGEATLVPSQLKYELVPQHGPTVKWCDIPVSRVWRCGNRGNVASVLIEKPPRGDFLPIADGGFSLQYSPLLEFRQGRGVALFCQLDVTGRTEFDPAGQLVARNLLDYLTTWKPSPRRRVLYSGEPAGKRHLESIGVSAESYTGGDLSPDQILVVGPGGAVNLSDRRGAIATWLKNGGHLLAVGLDQDECRKFLPLDIGVQNAEHIAAYFEPVALTSPLAGVGPADVHNRSPRQLPLVQSGVKTVGDGVLACSENGNVLFCQLVPWQFDDAKNLGLRRTYRRSSFLLSRLLANLGGGGSTPLVSRFSLPVAATNEKNRCLDGLYLDQPQEWDDPYRFFRW